MRMAGITPGEGDAATAGQSGSKGCTGGGGRPALARFETGVLNAARWTVDPGSADDPLCDTGRVAAELQIAETTARRWMRDGALRSFTTNDGEGIARRLARLSDVWALRDRLADRILLPDPAVDLGVRHQELYQCARRLGIDLTQHPTSRRLEISADAARQLRDEHARVRALHARAVKVAAAARVLDLDASTVRLMAERGDLDIDPETDSSRALFVTRASVEKASTGRRGSPSPAPVDALLEVPAGALDGIEPGTHVTIREDQP